MNNVRKSIGWADWTINPVKGLCPVGCSYCYARRAYGRNCNSTFKDKSIRYDPSVWSNLLKAKPGARIFVGSTIDLFHQACSEWNHQIITVCENHPELTFIFLTKCPKHLPQKWPDNCWVGVSATNFNMWAMAGIYLRDIQANVKFISFEPLQSSILAPDEPYGQYTLDMFTRDLKFIGISWVIIGRQTPVSKNTAPEIGWIKGIVTAADGAGIPVFLKSNLGDLIFDKAAGDSLYQKLSKNGSYGVLRQEFPETAGVTK